MKIKTYNPCDYCAGQGKIMLTERYNTEEEASAAFPHVIWDILGLGDTWEDWSLDAAAIMEAYMRAVQDADYDYYAMNKQAGSLYIPPGTYYVSMGHVWFWGSVNVEASDATFVGIDTNHAGTSAMFLTPFVYDFTRFSEIVSNPASSSLHCYPALNPSTTGVHMARAVLTVGADKSVIDEGKSYYKKPIVSGLTLNLPAVASEDYGSPYQDISNAQGAGYRFLGFYNQVFNGIRWNGPFKYGMILSDNYQGSAYGTFILTGKAANALVAIKFRALQWMNSLFFKGGYFSIYDGILYSQSLNIAHNNDTHPTVLIDSYHATDNENDPSSETINPTDYYGATNLLDDFATHGHVQFDYVQLENNNYVTLWQARKPEHWSFDNSRLEALNRPGYEAGGRLSIRKKIRLTSDSYYHNADNNIFYTDKFSGYYIPPIPEEYLQDGRIIVRGAVGLGELQQSMYIGPTYSTTEDLEIARAQSRIILYDPNYKYRRALSIDANGTLVTESLPISNVWWRNVTQGGAWRRGDLTLDLNDELDLAVNFNLSSSYGLYTGGSHGVYGYIRVIVYDNAYQKISDTTYYSYSSSDMEEIDYDAAENTAFKTDRDTYNYRCFKLKNTISYATGHSLKIFSGSIDVDLKTINDSMYYPRYLEHANRIRWK